MGSQKQLALGGDPDSSDLSVNPSNSYLALGHNSIGFAGEIYEVLIFAERLQDEKIRTIEGYLAHKWNTSSLLPNYHSYKANPPTLTPTLKTASTFDYESNASSYSIRVQVKDEYNATSEQTFTVSITNINEPPSLNGTGIINISESNQSKTISASWDRTYGGNGTESPSDIISLDNGGYLIAGTSDSNASAEKSQGSRGGKDYWVLKVDSFGNKIWDKTFGGYGDDTCKGIIKTIDNGYLLFGDSESNASGDKSEIRWGVSDYWLVKIDENGSKIWDKTFGGGNEERCLDTISLANGNFIIGGNSRSGNYYGHKSQTSLGENDFWILEIDENGTKIRDKTLGGSLDESLSSIQLTQDGGIKLVGQTHSEIGHDISEARKGGYDLWVIQLDNNWAKIWDRRYGGNSNEYLWGKRSVLQNSDGVNYWSKHSFYC